MPSLSFVGEARWNGTRLQQPRAALVLLALGVVYGDIGTSPLYAVKETFNPGHGIPLTADAILGGTSAIFWALMIVVSLKYATLIMRADNRCALPLLAGNELGRVLHDAAGDPAGLPAAHEHRTAVEFFNNNCMTEL